MIQRNAQGPTVIYAGLPFARRREGNGTAVIVALASGGSELLPSREIWEPFGSLRRDMERLFEDFSRDFGFGPPAAAGVGMAPRVDVSETESEIKIEAELPGVDERDVEVVLSDGRLTIKGARRSRRKRRKRRGITTWSSAPMGRSPARSRCRSRPTPIRSRRPSPRGAHRDRAQPPQVKAKQKKIAISKS